MCFLKLLYVYEGMAGEENPAGSEGVLPLCENLEGRQLLLEKCVKIWPGQTYAMPACQRQKGWRKMAMPG